MGGVAIQLCGAQVVTAHVMATENLAVADALAAVRQTHAGARPNPGFMRQLHVFHAMGCKIDTSHPQYKQLHVEALGRQWQEAGHVDATTFASTPETANSEVCKAHSCCMP